MLLVCSGNAGRISPFVKEQQLALSKLGIVFEYYLITGKGLFGYLRNLKPLKEKIRQFKPDLIHAHFGLSGLVAVLQRLVPVVVTYHGSDIHFKKNLRFSKIAIRLAKKNIFVSKALAEKAGVLNPIVIPCGIDLDIFTIQDRAEARRKMRLSSDKRYVLFSSAYANSVKNYPLARAAVEAIADPDLLLLELKGYSRQEVATLMNAVDVALLTSVREGSPQFIKEAMACDCPIVSTDVGDVKEVFAGAKNCFISGSSVADVSHQLKLALLLKSRTGAREKIKVFDNNGIALKIQAIYREVLEQNQNGH